MRRFVVSIHDVMPATLTQCAHVINLLRRHGVVSPTLLVVPGMEWTDADIEQLRLLQTDGAVLAGHGWHHKVDDIRRPYHRLHSAFISRNVAEHLALDAKDIRALVERCHQFFVDHELSVSELYVPPAWAMGRVTPEQLSHLPFRLFETLTGVFDAQRQVFTRSPMIGFEADTTFRALACRLWNRGNTLWNRLDTPTRMAIHPNDLSLRLGHDLQQRIERGVTNVSYAVFADSCAS